ncbi:FAD-dependent oxidoreductase [Pantanalinema sp. GBBB05]|uniref:FAD-dependent oxidoreductase n=1 Tax=Pantanalinema sp. GBBB05 TaxID=2604139 RepID=UPI001D707B67|nr:FAD-dependent oxidoreductase [Pantanalinema sp. GBBB05]
MQTLTTDVLVVGGGTGGTAAAIQAARRGVNTILVSEFPWLGGMLTSAGVSAPDGNELAAFQTGIWGAFLQELERRQPGSLDQGWVSFFTYDPRIGAQIFADWVAALPNLHWITGQIPLEVLKQDDHITGIRFADYTIAAQVILDGTELGDLLALAEIPHRWGWELQAEFGEPSAPLTTNALTQTYPVQAPTWVVVMRDYGEGQSAPEIPVPPNYNPALFQEAWDNYGGEQFLNYGRWAGNHFMINWPIHGNDYGEGIHRLMGSPTGQQQFLQEACWHSQSFARYIQTQLGQRYGLAADIFPSLPTSFGGGAYALHPYFRESRRLKGLTTIREQDILPIVRGSAASLPVTVWAEGCMQVENVCDAIAIGNYANDHHYPSGEIPLKPKSLRWGGRWTGTPFTIPYRSLVPVKTDGFLVCEKNISVSHIANGATRLQPLVLGIGQAAGMAAALCVEQGCQPRDLDVRSLQEALLTDAIAPAAVIPLFNLVINHPDWLNWQRYYLDHPEAYPAAGNCPLQHPSMPAKTHLANPSTKGQTLAGTYTRVDAQTYMLEVKSPDALSERTFTLVTLNPDVDQKLAELSQAQRITVEGRINLAGNWVLATAIIVETAL